jgi:hypothetical protein
MLESMPGALLQWAAVRTNLELIREPPHLNIHPPFEADQPIAPLKNKKIEVNI